MGRQLPPPQKRGGKLQKNRLRANRSMMAQMMFGMMQLFGGLISQNNQLMQRMVSHMENQQQQTQMLPGPPQRPAFSAMEWFYRMKLFMAVLPLLLLLLLGLWLFWPRITGVGAGGGGAQDPQGVVDNNMNDFRVRLLCSEGEQLCWQIDALMAEGSTVAAEIETVRPQANELKYGTPARRSWDKIRGFSGFSQPTADELKRVLKGLNEKNQRGQFLFPGQVLPPVLSARQEVIRCRATLDMMQRELQNVRKGLE